MGIRGSAEMRMKFEVTKVLEEHVVYVRRS